MDDLEHVSRALLRSRDSAVEQHVRGILTARGVDPDDRSAGWEARARSALADLELVDEGLEWDDTGRHVTARTTVRPRRLP
jgi:hypothetical protein